LKEEFIKVDHDYIVGSAKLAKAAGCEHFSLISSGGANANSWFLYMKVKVSILIHIVFAELRDKEWESFRVKQSEMWKHSVSRI
jgi:hypothetical protein